jgi:serine/threonine protein kinase
MSTSAKTSVLPAFGLKLPERYVVRRHIATGGMASVWCAQDRILGRLVAIKILAERFAYEEFAVRRFKREARAAARVSAHPHVVTIYDVGDLDSDDERMPPRAFMVMAYMAGGTVADALRNQTVERADALRWLQEAASALDHAHERGVVHRDIKPANFLLDQNKSLHVADFGIAHVQSEDTITSTGQLFGTAAYLAPEQALGHDATGASDRYALAVAAFELLTGDRPFTATHFAAQARQHIEEAPPRASLRNPSLPGAVDDVLARGMAKAPEERFPTARGFTDALAGVLGAAAAAPAPVPVVEPPAAPLAGAVTVPKAAALAADQDAGERHRRPPAGTTSRPRRGAALALSAAAVLVLALVALATQTGGSRNAKQNSSSHRAPTASASQLRSAKRNRSRSTRSGNATASAAGTPSSPAAGASSQAARTPGTSSSTAPASDAGALEAQGHQELEAHNYPAAISTLRQAVNAAPASSLTYAYALYDLADALYLSGDPAAAIPLLEQRLKIPNQTAVVQTLLDQARSAAGQGSSSASSPSSSGAPAGPARSAGGTAPTPGHQPGRVPPGHRPGHGHGPGD